jgi:hypothetical protein
VARLAGSVRRALELVVRSLGAGVVAAHAAGVLLITLAMVVEAADEPPAAVMLRVAAGLPAAWAQAAAVLGLVGVTVAAARMRRQGVVLGLGAVGLSPRALLLVGALCGALGGAVAGSGGGGAGGAELHAWQRGEGGWIRDGLAWPDLAGGVARPMPPPERAIPADLANAGAAGAFGAALGLYGGPVVTLLSAAVLLVADVVARGLCERGALPPWGAAFPAGLALVALVGVLWRAPLFPRRWG